MSRPSLDSSNRRDIEMRGFLWRNSTGSCRCWSWHCRCNCIQFQLPTFPNSLSQDLPDPYGAHSGSHSLSHSSGKIVKPGIWFDIIVTECLYRLSAVQVGMCLTSFIMYTAQRWIIPWPIHHTTTDTPLFLI